MKPVFIYLTGLAAMTISITSPAAADTNAAARIEIKKLLREVPLIDGHNDVPWQYRKRGGNLNTIDLAGDTSRLKPPMVTDISRMRAGGMGGQFWSVYVPVELPGAEAVQAVVEQIDVVYQMCARYPDALALALTADDVGRIHRQGKIASLIGMEGGHSINNSLGTLRMMYRLGARYMTLTHTKNTTWADAAGDVPGCRGLTPLGAEIVNEMNRLGMLVDLSHVTDETMRAVLRVTKAPVIFSHSSARALCDHPRDVPDDVLQMVKANGGVVMVCFLPTYLTEHDRARSALGHAEEERLEKLYPNDPVKVETMKKAWWDSQPPPTATLSDVADHIDHIRKVAGIDHVGIGADYEGFTGPPEGLEDVSKYPDLLVELRRRGYTPDEIKKVAGLNVLRAFRGAERVAAEMQHRPPQK